MTVRHSGGSTALVADLAQESPGSTGTFTGTLSSSDDWVAHAVALNGAAVGLSMLVG
jgi:hypothetical protein